MKRPLFVIIGSIIVLALIMVWVYILFFNSSTESTDSFSDLTLGDTTDTSYDPNSVSGEQTEPVVDVTGPEALRQLTTRPVVGYQDVTTTSSTSLVYYVESGTGHIFSIDLTSGEEKRISGTTIPTSRKAVITPNGQFVMIQSGSGNGAEFAVGEIDPNQESLSVDVIDERIVSFATTLNNTFLYAVQTNDSVLAKEYDPVTTAIKTIFTVPFREAMISWGKQSSGPHYFYPKATAQLEGYAYRVTGNKTDRLPVDGYGLSLQGSATGLVYSAQSDGNYRSFIYDTISGTMNPSSVTIIPEKCVGLTLASSSLVCGGWLGSTNDSLPDSWYQGNVSFADDIWLINTATGVAEELISISTKTGRQIDVINPSISPDDQRIYFTNSTDNYLWLYDQSVEQ